MAIPESKEELKKSRIFFTIDGATALTIMQLAGGAFLATLLSTLGISDSKNGTISSLAVLACIFQPVATILTRNLKKFKLFVCFTAITQRLLFTFIFFIPFLNLQSDIKIWLFVFCFLMAHIMLQMGAPAAQDWIASLVPQKLRGKYFGIRDLTSVFVISISMLVSGVILDYFKNNNNILTAFMVIGIIILVLTIINIISLSLISEPKYSDVNERGKELHGRLAKNSHKNHNSSFLSDLGGVFKDKRFKKVLILNIIWNISLFISATYNAIYLFKELSLPYTFIMTVVFIVNIIRIFVTTIWSKLGDKYGMARILKYAFLFLGINYLVLAFTVPQNAYIMFCIGSVFGAIAWGFIGVGILGVQLDYTPIKKRIAYMSINSSIAGICGFIFSVIGGFILNYIQAVKPTIFGKVIYGQQILNLISFFVIIITILYIKFSLQKEKKIVSNTDGRI
jgi:MFS family permease